jgi:hypothetical protein
MIKRLLVLSALPLPAGLQILCICYSDTKGDFDSYKYSSEGRVDKRAILGGYQQRRDDYKSEIRF